MTRLLKHFVAAIALAVICFGAAAKSQATPVVLTITNPAQTVAPGGSIVFAGTLFNPNTVPFTLTQVTLTEVTPGGVAQVLSVFIPSGFPPNPIPGLTTESGNILGVNFRPAAIPGVYSYTIDVRGMVPGGTIEISNLFPVTVTIQQSVPEPASMLLLGTGLMGAFGAIRRRAKSKV